MFPNIVRKIINLRLSPRYNMAKQLCRSAIRWQNHDFMGYDPAQADCTIYWDSYQMLHNKAAHRVAVNGTLLRPAPFLSSTSGKLKGSWTWRVLLFIPKSGHIGKNFKDWTECLCTFGIYFPCPLGYLRVCNATALPKFRLHLSAVCLCAPNDLNHESLHLILQTPDLVHQVAGFVRGDARCNHGSADTAGTTQSCLAWNINIWNVLWQKISL